MSLCECWTTFTNLLKTGITRALVFLAKVSVRRPLVTVITVTALAALTLAVGVVTGFHMETDGFIMWTPLESTSLVHGSWVRSPVSGFPMEGRPIQIILHKQGANILTRSDLERVFEVVQLLQDTAGFDQVCGGPLPGSQAPLCSFLSPSQFWSGDYELFKNSTSTNDDIAHRMSYLTFPDGELVNRGTIYGQPFPALPVDPQIDPWGEYQVEDVLLESVSAYMIILNLPDDEDNAPPYELAVTDALFALEDSWKTNHRTDSDGDDGSIAMSMELFTSRSFDDELLRGIEGDIPYVALAYLMMGCFCAATLYRRDPVQSQTLLGLGAVCTVALSLMSGYGMIMLCHVPFTSLLQIFPYVLVGIGLDDTYILMGAFTRTTHSDSMEVRVEYMMEDVGVSIFVSTLTTFLAFFLGAFSSLPAFKWFAYYAAPTVMIDFVYQVTFFLALLAMDVRRQQQGRRDCCPCCTIDQSDIEDLEDTERFDVADFDDTESMPDKYIVEAVNGNTQNAAGPNESPGENRDNTVRGSGATADCEVAMVVAGSLQEEAAVTGQSVRTMIEKNKTVEDMKVTDMEESQKTSSPSFFARGVDHATNVLLQPFSKVVVLISFVVLLIAGALGASQLEQDFDYQSLTPADSFVRAYQSTLDAYFEAGEASRALTSYCYFRDIDVTSYAMQKAMLQYVSDMGDLEIVQGMPARFWLVDFLAFFDNERNDDEDMFGSSNSNDTEEIFYNRLDLFLSTEPYRTLYMADVVRRDRDSSSSTRKVTASRVKFEFEGIDVTENSNQIAALEKQRDVAKSQPLNDSDPGDWKMFSFGLVYYAWELYAVIAREVFQSAILGLLAVFFIALCFLQHPLGALIVPPVVVMVYVDLMGLFYVAGIPINTTSCLGLTMSIGLVVDYVMHVVHTFLVTDGGNRNARVQKVMTTMGKSILLGAVSTLLGVIPLAFSQSDVFRTIFFTYLGIVVFGATHGLILTPVILSIVGPSPLPYPVPVLSRTTTTVAPSTP